MNARWVVTGMVVAGAAVLASTTWVPAVGQTGRSRGASNTIAEEGPIVRTQYTSETSPPPRRLPTEPRRQAAKLRSSSAIEQTSMDDPPMPRALPAVGTEIAEPM